MVWQEKIDFGDCFFDDDRHMLANEKTYSWFLVKCRPTFSFVEIFISFFVFILTKILIHLVFYFIY